jgi:hypothetical protein
VVAFDDNGKAVAEQEVYCWQALPNSLDPDRKTIRANGDDISL